MSTTVLEPEVDVKQKVYTKDELDELRKKLLGRISNIGVEQEPPSGGSNQEPPEWKTDVELIIKFLRDIEKVMGFLVEKRIPGEPKRLLQKAMEGLAPNLDDAIKRALKQRPASN